MDTGIIESKIARICWNTNSWSEPSGRIGKSKNKNSYEYIYGFGHEEWLFDFNVTLNGYHYAFLQSINSHWDIYINKIFNISLYSINSETGEKWWIGEIENVQVIDMEESRTISQYYESKGWKNDMINQLNSLSLNSDNFRDTEMLFNIRFKPEDARNILNEPKLISKDDALIRSFYYSSLLSKNSEPLLHSFNEVFAPGHNPSKRSFNSTYSEQSRKIDKKHALIQDMCYEQLVKEYGEMNVETEYGLNYGAKVDIVCRDSKASLVFFEIKTDYIPRVSIRNSLSQLLEYSIYGAKNRASKLIIISQSDLDIKDIEYLKRLRELIRIPVFYRKIDIKRKVLLSEQ